MCIKHIDSSFGCAVSVLFSNAREHGVFRRYNVTAEFASKIKTWLISSDG